MLFHEQPPFVNRELAMLVMFNGRLIVNKLLNVDLVELKLDTYRHL